MSHKNTCVAYLRKLIYDICLHCCLKWGDLRIKEISSSMHNMRSAWSKTLLFYGNNFHFWFQKRNCYKIDLWSSFLGAYFDQAITNFPREDSGVIPFVFFNFFLNLGSCDSGFASSNHSRSNAARFLVSVQYLRDTSVGYPKLPWDYTWSYTCSG